MENQNQSLLAIVGQTVEIEKMLIESGGELTAEIEAALIVNEQSLAEKADGYHNIIERFKALDNHYSKKAEFYAQIAKQCDGVVERLKANIELAMTTLKVIEIKGEDIRFKLSPTAGKLILVDEDMIPVEFKKEVSQTEIQKDALKAALQKGPVAGAKLEKGLSLRAYANIPDKTTKTKSAKKIEG